RFMHKLEGHSSPVTHVAVTPVGLWGVSVSADHTLLDLDLTGGFYPRTMAGPNKLVDGFCLSPDGGWVLAASTDKTMGIMKRGDDYIRAAFMNDSKVLSCAFADANRVVTADSAGYVHVFAVGFGITP